MTNLVMKRINLMSFNKNKQWADKFIPEIKTALAPYLIRVPNLEADIKRCSDLITLNKRISVRTRKYEDLRYKHEFTIRAKTKNKNRTELEKIATGWGDFIFYSFASQDESRLVYWVLGDLNIFRNIVFNNPDLQKNYKQNRDGTGFVCFYWRDFPNMIVAKKDFHESA